MNGEIPEKLKEKAVKRIALFAVIALAFGVATWGCCCMPGHHRMMKNEKMETAQMYCPMTGNPINKDIHTDYMGRTIYLCSMPCKEAFEKMSDSDKAETVKKMNMKEERKEGEEKGEKMEGQKPMMQEQKPMQGGTVPMGGEQK